MLNERISAFSEIGNKDGLYFIYRCIKDGTSSIASLKQFVVHHPGHIEVQVDAAIMLYEQLGILSYNQNEDLIILNIEKDWVQSAFLEHLSKKILKLVISEEIIDFESLSYDILSDCFYASRKCIHMKYACIRNLLITLNLLEKRTNNTYFVSAKFIEDITPHISHRRKISQEELITQLEKQTDQGKAGETFVLEYEKKRLRGRADLDCIKQISFVDVSAGYDIISFNDKDSFKLDRLIEVKTYVGKPHFHWSSNEMDIAKVRMEHYFIYLVSYNDMLKEGYDPIIIQNPISYLENNSDWQFSIDSITVKKL